MSKAEALREQQESVFKKEDLNNVPILPESPYGDIPDITFCSPDIQIESIRPEKALDLIKIPVGVLKESYFCAGPYLRFIFFDNHLMKALYHLPGGMQTSLPSLKRAILLTLRVTDLCP